jgi:hypothetical protein
MAQLTNNARKRPKNISRIKPGKDSRRIQIRLFVIQQWSSNWENFARKNTKALTIFKTGKLILKSVNIYSRVVENSWLQAMLWIRKYFFRIRIWITIRGSVTFNNGSGSRRPINCESGRIRILTLTFLWTEKKICRQIGTGTLENH